MALALIRVSTPASATALASTSVGAMRLSRRLCLKAPDHRRWPMLTPQRLTTASTSTSASESNSPLSGFQCNSSEFAGARRTMRNTGWSAALNAAAKAEPIRPEEPAIAMTGLATFSQPQIGLERSLFEPVLDRCEETSGIGTVDQPMVIGQREVADRADPDRFVAAVVYDHPRPFDDGPGAQHGGLRRNQDRGVEQRALAADVGDGEGATGQLVGFQVSRPGARGDVGDRPGQARQRQVAGVVDDGGEQALLGVDGEAEVLGVVIGDLLRFLVVAGVDVGMNLEGVDRGPRDERQEGQVHPLPLGERGLGPGPQPDDP